MYFSLHKVKSHCYNDCDVMYYTRPPLELLVKRLIILPLLLLLVLVSSCSEQYSPPKRNDEKGASSATSREKRAIDKAKGTTYNVYKGRYFSFRYPSNWVISPRQWMYPRGFGIVSINNFHQEGFWPGMFSNDDGGSSWSPEIAQLQVPSDGAFLMIWVFEGPGSEDNLPDKLDKTQLTHTSKSRGPTENYSLYFQSGGTPYIVNLFLNGASTKMAKKEGLGVIDSLRLESVNPTSTQTVEATNTIPIKVDANGLYEVITESPVINVTHKALRYGEHPLVDIEVLGKGIDKSFNWSIMDVSTTPAAGGSADYVDCLVKVSNFKQSQTLQFKVKRRDIAD